jgi:hypothetical protein
MFLGDDSCTAWPADRRPQKICELWVETPLPILLLVKMSSSSSKPHFLPLLCSNTIVKINVIGVIDMQDCVLICHSGERKDTVQFEHNSFAVDSKTMIRSGVNTIGKSSYPNYTITSFSVRKRLS